MIDNQEDFYHVGLELIFSFTPYSFMVITTQMMPDEYFLLLDL